MGHSSRLNQSLQIPTIPKDRGVWLVGVPPFASPASLQSGCEQASPHEHQQAFMKLCRREKMHAESLMLWQLAVSETGRKANHQECL